MSQGREREENVCTTVGASLSVRWVQGFPKQNVHFINKSTICYPCGNFVIFINIETKKKTVLQCMNGVVGVVAANVPYEVVAFSDRRLKPVIYIYNFPGLTRRNKLKGNVLLDYTLLSFSYCGTYLASYSSLPEFELALWNWEAGVILCKKSQPGVDVSQMTFNPMNWRQLCLSSPSAVTVWTIERCNEEHHLKAKSVKLPMEDGSFCNETDVIFPTSLPKDLIYGPVLPLSAIAGLVGEEAETFRPKDDLYPLLHPSMHCWTPTSDIYVGCEEGHLLMINGETLKVTVLNKIEDTVPKEGRNLISPVTMVYQKGGMLISGIDGFVYSFIIKDLTYKVEDFLEIEDPVVHMMFSPNYCMLLIQTDKGSVYIYTPGEKPTYEKVLEACDGKFQAIDFIPPGNEYCMTLTHSGEVCVWYTEDGTCASRIYLNTPATVLACSPSSLSAAVGTTGGSIHFLDVRDAEAPKAVHKAFPSEWSVQHLLYDQQGIYLLAGTSEGYIFVINANPSSSFQILGFVEVSKDILQISTVSLLETDIVEVMVLSPLPETGRSRLEIFTLPKILPRDLTVSASFTDERGRLKDKLIHRFQYEIEHSLSSAVLDFQSQQVYGFCSQVSYICSYLLPEKVLAMMEENETVDNIAKLDQKEFGLDLEELERLHDENEEEVAKIRKDAEMQNLAKAYLAELIKEECWNSMAVKGRALKCFHLPYVVENFPMKERTEEELKELKRVLRQKKIETECLKVRKEIIEAQSAITLAKKHHEEEDEEEEEEVAVKNPNLPNYLLGSLSTDFGVQASFLSSQLELHSREEKINQIILLKDVIYKVKTAFNREFDAAYKQKEFEVARVKERNVRIREIILDLDLEEVIWQPEFDDCEKPERTLVVENKEITAQKFINPWLKAKAGLTVTHEMERWLQTRGPNTRHRALMDMMGGVLEVKKEDILRMVIPQPAFMAKPDALWSEEERKQFKDYEKKVRELNEERDKYRKSLEAEMKKLQNSIQESTQNFDEHLKRLFERRVKAEMVVNQEELKINNLVFSLLLDEEISSREAFLNNYLTRKQEEKNQTSEAIQKAREDLDVYKEHYDNLLAEDKVLDRSFKKEFSEIPSHQVDTLYKLFKRRPRIHKQKMHSDTAGIVPFGERPESGKLNKDAFAQLMKAMDDLDNINNMPEGLDPSVWDHFCVTRRVKVENEHKVKQKAAGLMEMITFLRRRTEDDEKLQQEIEKVLHEQIVLQEEKVRFQLNLTIQVLLKQGQVELENFQLLLEYPDAILINKNIIEDLNSVIRTQGQKKVASMMESKDVHKGIFQIEWEHRKMEMEMEDLNQKAWDIQMLFFSRDRQKYLNEPNYETLIAIQIGIMEQTIAVLEKTHKKNVENCKKLLKKLGRYSNQKDVANYTLSCNLREELVAVSERKDICNAIGSKLTCEKIAKERYENMMQHQKLTKIAKQQAEQISILQAEVERLRMKTFPALVQI
ncbi:cilia- and flagella-associated protein 43 isoform X7 [Mustela putorius furo]|uniref:Cilia- and flagella-associated protein 43 n=1 Tax=Mustela putorius furo TaxID=9669 RepID=A0A8U0RKL8_MUSPF|nr:cilia- and flagella-associated protein 43 isoform X7 [Mustela putorius furo]